MLRQHSCRLRANAKPAIIERYHQGSVREHFPIHKSQGFLKRKYRIAAALEVTHAFAEGVFSHEQLRLKFMLITE
jgi:hypothetical protein